MPSRTKAARYSRRRRRRIAASTHDLTDAQWFALKGAWAGCAYCGAEDPNPQRDCVLPISRGGRYTIINVVPACQSCNASKGNLEVTTWMRRKKFDEREFLVRQARIARMVAGQHQAEPPLEGQEKVPKDAVSP